MDEAAELSDYLPPSFGSPKEQEYVAFLWDAFETNYTHGKYQFAFFAYHMLTMSFVYFNIWQIKKMEPKNFEMSLIGFDKKVEKILIDATSPFGFSGVRERSILRIFKLIACDNGEIGTYAKLVDERNQAAHSNGHIFFSTQAALDTKITEVLRVVHEIQTHSNALAESLFATVECELLQRVRLTNREEAKTEIFRFLEGFYNRRRRHSALGYVAPVEFERAWSAAQPPSP